MLFAADSPTFLTVSIWQSQTKRTGRTEYASGDLKVFRVGLAKTAAVQIARSSTIEFARKNQGRTITQAEIDQCLEE